MDQNEESIINYIKQGSNLREIYLDGTTALTIALKKNLHLNVIKFMLENGADTYLESTLRNSLQNRTTLNVLLQNHFTLNLDFYKTFLRKDLSDFEQYKETTELIKWIYCGVVDNFTILKQFTQKLSLSKRQVEAFSGRKRLRQDLIRLSKSYHSKDFEIITNIENFTIKFHKIVLAARSKFFRPIILNNENSYKVKGILKNKPKIVWENYYHFIYTNELKTKFNNGTDYRAFKDLVQRTRVSTFSNLHEDFSDVSLFMDNEKNISKNKKKKQKKKTKKKYRNKIKNKDKNSDNINKNSNGITENDTNNQIINNKENKIDIENNLAGKKNEMKTENGKKELINEKNNNENKIITETQENENNINDGIKKEFIIEDNNEKKH